MVIIMVMMTLQPSSTAYSFSQEGCTENFLWQSLCREKERKKESQNHQHMQYSFYRSFFKYEQA
jgi:hypothetical protein